MIRVVILYPNTRGSSFDHDYYLNVHLPLAIEKMGPYGLLRAEANRVLPDGDGTAPEYHQIGLLYFESADDFHNGMKAVGDAIRSDLPNYTNVSATVFLTEMLGTVDA